MLFWIRTQLKSEQINKTGSNSKQCEWYLSVLFITVLFSEPTVECSSVAEDVNSRKEDDSKKNGDSEKSVNDEKKIKNISDVLEWSYYKIKKPKIEIMKH